MLRNKWLALVSLPLTCAPHLPSSFCGSPGKKTPAQLTGSTGAAGNEIQRAGAYGMLSRGGFL